MVSGKSGVTMIVEPSFSARRAASNAMRPLAPSDVVRGQFRGYRQEKDVAANSTVETFAAIRLRIDTPRWSGVPIYIRAGKRLPVTQTELRLVFKHPPRLEVFPESRSPEANQLVVKLDPSTGIRLIVDARRTDIQRVGRIELDMEFADEGGEGATPYEVLLHAAMVGDSTRFTRQDGVDEQWRIMQPLLDAPPTVHAYKPGSWGPEAAEKLVAGSGSWHTPWLAS